MTSIFKPLVLLALILTSCNINPSNQLTEVDTNALKKAHDDSVQLVIDSLKKVNIYLPPLYDKYTFDSATTIKFFEMAKATQGELKLLVNSKLITKEIINIIDHNAIDHADILFLIDKTGSMEDDIINVQKGLTQIVESLNHFKNIRLGIALYGDKNSDGKDWFSFQNFEMDYNAAQKFIQHIKVTAGADYPESVYEGFFESNTQDFWRSEAKRMVILIGDAPPLEKPLSKYSISDVIEKATLTKTKMNFYPIVVTPYADDYPKSKSKKTFTSEKIITTLYPNPSMGIVNVDFTNVDEYQIEIYNSAGIAIINEKYTGNQWQKDLSSFENGAYVLRAVSKEMQYESVKFILNK